MNFADRLTEAIRRKETPLMVGLDPRLELLPRIWRDSLRGSNTPQFSQQAANAVEEFCMAIIDVVASFVPAIKPQMAFFEQLGPAGMSALARVIDHACSRELLVILDGKRSDIGTTAEGYAKAYLGRKPQSAWGADALTVNPWLGRDSFEPFVQQARASSSGIFVLVKTSNPGSEHYQSRLTDGIPLYHRVAADIEDLAVASMGDSEYGIAGAVAGATYPEQLAELRTLMRHAYFLIPGFGAQGGTAKDVACGFDSRGLGAIVNSSRAIIFAYDSPHYAPLLDGNWQTAVERATRDAIAQLATDTPAGNLKKVKRDQAE